MDTVALFGVFFLLILLGVPIGFSIGIATTITLFFFSDVSLLLVIQNSISGVDSFPLLAIPFFLLAGNLMSVGGIAKRLINFANNCLGAIPGALGMVATVSSMFFAAISGSGAATTSAIGTFMIPEMKKHNYDVGFSASLIAAAGTIGVVIPPSIPFVIYGIVVGCSIRDLFIAGFIPGLLMGIVLLIVVYVISKKEGYGRSRGRIKLTKIWISFKSSFWALLSPLIVLGSIYSGIVTPTEAALISVIYSFIVGSFVYKELDLSSCYKALYDTIIISGITTFLIGFSTAFAIYITLDQIPIKITNFLLSITDNRIFLLLLINIFLILVGCFIDIIPATIILAPILLPVVENFGMSPVTFGVLLTINLAIGFVTPPYGVDLFIASAIANISIGRMIKPILRFISALIIVLLLVTYVPATTLSLITLFK